MSSKKAKISKFQGTKTEVLPILKNARFTGSGAKSWPRAVLPPGWSKLALNGSFKGFRLPKRRSKLQKGKIELQSDQKRRPARRVRPGKSFRENRLCLGVLCPPRAWHRGTAVSGSSFFGTLGRQSVFWKRRLAFKTLLSKKEKFQNFKAPKRRCFQY